MWRVCGATIVSSDKAFSGETTAGLALERARHHPASEGGATATAWEEIKEAVRQGWDSVREAFDIDDDVAVPPGTGGPDGYFRPSNG